MPYSTNERVIRSDGAGTAAAWKCCITSDHFVCTRCGQEFLDNSVENHGQSCQALYTEGSGWKLQAHTKEKKLCPEACSDYHLLCTMS